MELIKQLEYLVSEIREMYQGDYLDICFTGDSIMITNCEDIKINSKDKGKTWTRRGEND